jgi:hypothetical protein
MSESQVAPPEQVTLTLEDLNSVLQIIDVATTRGAFRPKEFTAVGTVYEKISNFLGQVKDTAAPAADAAPAEPTSAE